MPKVSVLMPIYNTQEAHLREAMESILAQTFTDFEFLILNDSPENTALDAIVSSYKDTRIKYSKNMQNMGITPSRNKLMELAEGEYLAVMDHDDVSLPERFAKQVAFLDAHPDHGVVSCGDTEAPLTEAYRRCMEDAQIRLRLFYTCELLHPASMLRKSVLVENALKYEEAFSPAEDYALWCRLIPYTKFHNLDEVLFVYRNHADNTSKKQVHKMRVVTENIRLFLQRDNPQLYQEFQAKAEHRRSVKLFGKIPLLTFYRRGNVTVVKFLKYFPILKITRESLIY